MFLPAMICLSITAYSQETAIIPVVRLSPADHPAIETLFAPSLDQMPAVKPDPAWYAKTGSRKGLSGQADTDEELFIAPDAAILARGFSVSWQAILAEHQEPSVLAGPEDIAGLSKTKPLLIIPSGALSGTAASTFFKAGLAEYLRSGGVIFCLAQKNGADFSALPVPEGQRLEAAGWSEDSGPLFKASTIQDAHPLTANLTRPVPFVETDGYITAWPAESRILLSRSDGFPTAVVYPYEKGWVVVTALFIDFSSLVGSMEHDEKILVRDLLAWAKDSGKPLTTASQASPAAVPPARNRSGVLTGQPVTALSSLPVIRAEVERKGGRANLTLEIPPMPQFTDQSVLVRTAGQERSLTAGKDKARLSFEIPLAGNERRVSYALYRTNGRAIARGSVALPGLQENVSPGRPYYFPGDTAAVDIAGTGKGELTLQGVRFVNKKMIADRDSMTVKIPRDLPSGTYRMRWTFEEMDETKKNGEFAIDLCGYRTFFENVTLEHKQEGGRISATAGFKIQAGQKSSGQLKVVLRGPGGKTIQVADPVLSLIEGSQTIPVSFSFTPDSAGIWEMIYSLHTTLPKGAGIPAEPVEIASGSMIFDAGDAAVLAVITDKALYNEASGAVDITGIVAGKGRKTITVHVDEKKISGDQVELGGTTHYRASLRQPGPGVHTINVRVADKTSVSSQERLFTYGLGLPDLTVNIGASGPSSGPQGPVMSVTMMVRNQGKSSATPGRVALYEGDPAKSGSLLSTMETPKLAPKEQHTAAYDWPLYGKAGARVLVAVVTADTARESNKNNNKASAEIAVPGMLLLSNAGKPAFNAGDPLSLPLSLFNLTNRDVHGLSLHLQVEDASGGKVFSETVAVPEIAAGTEKKIDPRLKLVAPQVGTYTFSAGLSGDKQAAAVTTSFGINPTLLLTGNLEGTPAAATSCRPFSVRYNLENAGNIVPSSGTVRFELIPSGAGELAFTKKIPLAFGVKRFPIDSRDLPQGAYTARLTASAANEQFSTAREFVLAEQALAVSGPVSARRMNTSFPRVLLWLGREGRVIEQAVSESIAKQAFEQEDLYFKIVDSEEAFFAQAMTGMFNTYVLFEPQEMPGKTDWLKNRLQRGDGIVIIGSGEFARALAQDFGFTFEETPSKKTSILTFEDKSCLDLSGTMPVSGESLSPQKKGAKSAAVYSDSGQPAVLVDSSQKGKIVVMPFSLSRSAFNGGTTSLYSLVLRKTAFFAAPERDEPGRTAAGGVSISSLTGPVNARIKEILPLGSKVLWTNAEGRIDNNTISYELKADQEQRRLLYLYQLSNAEKTSSPVTEIYYDCDGSFKSQGKID